MLHFAGHDPFGINRWLILGYITSNLLLGFLPTRAFFHPLFYYLVVPLDTLFVGVVIYLSGTASTDFYLIFFLIIMVAAMGRELRYIVVSALAILLFYVWAMWTAELFIPPVRIPFLLVVAVFIGHLTEQASRESHRVQRVLEDKRKLEEAERRLRESEAKFRRLTETLMTPIFIFREGRFLYVNPAAEILTGYSEKELLGMNAWDLLAPDFRSGLGEREFQRWLQRGVPERCELEIITRRGEKRWLDVSLGVIEFEGRKAGLGTATDITQRKQREHQLLHSASHDPLTGLPNRAFVTDKLKELLEQVRRGENRLFSLLYLDLDRFKLVNDSLGHPVGDRLLTEVAQRLRRCLPEGDVAARIGGDEFVVLLHKIQSVGDALVVSERIHQQLLQPFRLNGQEVFISASIGIALGKPGYQHPEDLLRDADTAMYRAKTNGRFNHQVFHTTTHTRAAELLQLERELRKAVDGNELCLHYQPIVFLDTGGLAGFEALVRWNHPTRGLLPPAAFLPLAEESGLIVPIGWWVAREACRQMQEWQRQSPLNLSLFINVNLSYRQFLQPDLVERIDQILTETRLKPYRLHLEFTENILVQSNESTAVKLLLLRALGVKLLIDDFGTGYTLLSHLQRFPTDMLKIDRSFVSRMRAGSRDSELVRILVSIAQAMGVEVIAEGVENREQQRLLLQLGCKYGQGFLFAKPLAAEEAATWISSDLGLDTRIRHSPPTEGGSRGHSAPPLRLVSRS